MGEEEKKMEENKPEEGKGEEKKEEEPKAADEKEQKNAEESKEPPPPPPPQEIVLRVYMHCEGCARKVRRCLKGFEGVEDVQTDYRTQKVIVKGDKADPLKVLERVQKKSHRRVELISPIPPPTPPPEEKEEEKEAPKPEEKKEEPQVITLVLKVRMHCEACAQEIKRRILRMKGVENVEADLKSSQVTVSGIFEPEKLVDYVYKRTGKHAVVVNPEPEKKEEDKAKKADGGGAEKSEAAAEEKKDGDGEAGAAAPAAAEREDENARVVDVKKNEFYYYNYPQNVQYQSYPYPPQIFSDENPHACSVM